MEIRYIITGTRFKRGSIQRFNISRFSINEIIELTNWINHKNGLYRIIYNKKQIIKL